MSDFEDVDLFLESWISPQKRKRKKGSKKEKKKENNTTRKSVQTTKKEPKDAAAVRKENKKEKKKKRKKKPRLEVDEKPAASDQNSAKKTKRKKKVLFDLSPKYIRAKRPKFVSSTPKDKETSESPQDESQCNSDDNNSQDLFITQKTFRTPDETFSGETSSPPDLRQQNNTTSSQELHLDVWKPKTDEDNVQKMLKSNLTEKKDVKPRVVNQFLNDPIVVGNPPKNSNVPSRTNTSTQTENFFTTELSSYLRFCRNIPATDLKPLDLSLPKRKHLSSCLSVTKIKDEEEEEQQRTPGEGDRGVRLSSSSQQKDEGTKKNSSGGSQISSRLQSEVISIDTTSSSEDSEPPGRKLDLTQVRAIQMRLNESFFFKSKGDGGSPRPESPLMKLSVGRDVKHGKIRR